MEQKNTSILAVGLTEDVLAPLHESLLAQGSVLTSTPTLAEGLKQKIGGSYDLFLLSESAYTLDGGATLATFAEHGAITGPVLLLCEGVHADDVVVEALSRDVDDYVRLPVSTGLLLARINIHLDLLHTRRQEEAHLKNEQVIKLEHDLEVARNIQNSFLPTTLPQADGWEIAAYFQPARDVAGDFYDAFSISQGRRIIIVIGDVVDKGVPAALFMALVRSLMRAFAQQNYSLSWTDVLDDLGGSSSSRKRPGRGRAAPTTGTSSLMNAVTLTNNYIIDNHIDLNYFATCFVGMIDPARGQLSYINAGHNPPYILDAAGKIREFLPATGPAVGMIPGATYEIAITQIEQGETLYTYTDGVPEARDAAGVFYTDARLKELIARPFQSANGIVDLVHSELDAFGQDAVQFDDITMLAVHREAG